MKRRIYIWHFSEAFRWFEGVDEKSDYYLSASNLATQNGRWEIPTLVNANEQGLLKKPTDFPVTTGYCHLISENVKKCLGAVFERNGEVLPVNILDTDVASGFFLYKCTNVIDCLDINNSVLKYSPIRQGEVAYISDPVFLEENLPQSGFFVVPEKIGGHIYVTEDIKARVEHEGLKGMVLIEKPFGSEQPWIS